MKTIRLLAIMLCISLAIGCSDDSDENGMKDLAGTIYSAYSAHDRTLEEDIYDTFSFLADGRVERSTRAGGPRGRIIRITSGNYNVDYPAISIWIETVTLKGGFVDEEAFRIDQREYIRQ